jgi:hypothetical protein
LAGHTMQQYRPPLTTQLLEKTHGIH